MRAGYGYLSLRERWGKRNFWNARISALYKDPHLDPLPFWERGTERQVSLPGMLRLLARMLAP